MYHINDQIQKTIIFFLPTSNVIGQELRTAFKYIRNEYAHDSKKISKNQCLTLQHRLNALLLQVNNVISNAV